jgi:hypothetical protein
LGYNESIHPYNYKVKISQKFVVCGISYKLPDGRHEDGKIILECIGEIDCQDTN